MAKPVSGIAPQIVLEKPVSGSRRQPLQGEKVTPMATAGKEDRRGVGEVAGGTAAECAAICCCCPCVVMDLLLLAVYKVPTGLFKTAWRKQQRQRMKKKKAAALLQQRPQQQGRPLEATSSSSKATGSSFDDSEVGRSDGDDWDGSAADFETEMLDRFYGGGFWRSNSQKEA